MADHFLIIKRPWFMDGMWKPSKLVLYLSKVTEMVPMFSTNGPAAMEARHRGYQLTWKQFQEGVTIKRSGTHNIKDLAEAILFVKGLNAKKEDVIFDATADALGESIFDERPAWLRDHVDVMRREEL
jgi:hypothetical protein